MWIRTSAEKKMKVKEKESIEKALLHSTSAAILDAEIPTTIKKLPFNTGTQQLQICGSLCPT